MLKNFFIAAPLLIYSCGTDNDSSKIKTVYKSIEPQGFVLTTMELHADPQSCADGQKGARAILKPLDPSKKAFSAITCYESERTQTDARSVGRRDPNLELFAPAGADSRYEFFETFDEFCQVNEVSDLAASVKLDGENSAANMDDIDGYSCNFDPQKVVSLRIRNDLSDDSFFDMRVLRYFPNLRKVQIDTTSLAGMDLFEPIPTVTYLRVYIQGVDLEREIEQLQAISKRFPFVSLLKVEPYIGTKIEGGMDISFVANLTSLQTLVGFLPVKNIDSLKDHQNLRFIELPHAKDQFSYLPPKLEILRYEIDTTSNYNWADQKKIKIKRFNFEEAQ